MGRPEVVRLSPALIQQILSGACAPESEPETQDGLTEAERESVTMATGAVPHTAGLWFWRFWEWI